MKALLTLLFSFCSLTLWAQLPNWAQTVNQTYTERKFPCWQYQITRTNPNVAIETEIEYFDCYGVLQKEYLLPPTMIAGDTLTMVMICAWQYPEINQQPLPGEGIPLVGEVMAIDGCYERYTNLPAGGGDYVAPVYYWPNTQPSNWPDVPPWNRPDAPVYGNPPSSSPTGNVSNPLVVTRPPALPSAPCGKRIASGRGGVGVKEYIVRTSQAVVLFFDAMQVPDKFELTAHYADGSTYTADSGWRGSPDFEQRLEQVVTTERNENFTGIAGDGQGVLSITTPGALYYTLKVTAPLSSTEWSFYINCN